MADRSGDWLDQAHRDLESARAQREAGFHEWACFISQQAAEKGAKAVLQRFGAEAWGHSVLSLLRAIGEQTEVPEALYDHARTLDHYYVPSRYPNGFDSGKPADYIGERDADESIGGAEAILRFCNGLLAR